MTKAMWIETKDYKGRKVRIRDWDAEEERDKLVRAQEDLMEEYGTGGSQPYITPQDDFLRADGPLQEPIGPTFMQAVGAAGDDFLDYGYGAEGAYGPSRPGGGRQPDRDAPPAGGPNLDDWIGRHLDPKVAVEHDVEEIVSWGDVPPVYQAGIYGPLLRLLIGSGIASSLFRGVLGMLGALAAEKGVVPFFNKKRVAVYLGRTLLGVMEREAYSMFRRTTRRAIRDKLRGWDVA